MTIYPVISMPTQIFVNLPVKNLANTKEFFTKLGFGFNPQFTDDKAACLIIGENIFGMLLLEEFFKTFTRKEIADATKTTEMLLAVTVENRKAVDEMVEKAVAAGATVYREPEDHGWMYGHSFADLDGHQWEVCTMDMSKFPSQP